MKKGIMKMFVNREKLTVWFECEGDVWNWGTKKIFNSSNGCKITEMARDAEVKDFAYEMYLDKFIKKNREYVKEVVEL